MALTYGQITENITAPSSGRILYVDASNSSSYTGSGTTWTDLSGNGNNMTLAGSPTFTKLNTLGYFTFPGSEITKYAQIRPFSMPTTTVSTEIWINVDQGPATSRYFVSYEVNAAGNNLVLGVSALTGLGGIIITALDTTSIPSLPVKLDTGTWIHYVTTHNRTSGAWKAYINGNEIVSSTLNAGVNFTANGSLVLAQEQDGEVNNGGSLDANQAYSGKISSFSVWNKVLSAKEISQLYYKNKSRFGL